MRPALQSADLPGAFAAGCHYVDMAMHMSEPHPTDRESAIASHIEGQKIWGSPAYADEERWAADAVRAFDRCFDPAGVGRQFFAVQASGSRADALRNVTTPTGHDYPHQFWQQWVAGFCLGV